jgi:hypothetical protein
MRQAFSKTIPGSQLCDRASHQEAVAGSASASASRCWGLGVCAALDQPIATGYQLAPIDLAESAQYRRHHLALVDRTDPLFCRRRIARLQGQPRPATRAERHCQRRTYRCRHRRQSVRRRRVRQESGRRTSSDRSRDSWRLERSRLLPLRGTATLAIRGAPTMHGWRR